MHSKAKLSFTYELPLVTAVEDRSLSSTIPAILADIKVAVMPVIKAEKASLAKSGVRLGANCMKTPIWFPTDPMFPKPAIA